MRKKETKRSATPELKQAHFSPLASLAARNARSDEKCESIKTELRITTAVFLTIEVPLRSPFFCAARELVPAPLRYSFRACARVQPSLLVQLQACAGESRSRRER